MNTLEAKFVVDTEEAQQSITKLLALMRDLQAMCDGLLNVQRMVIKPGDTLVIKSPIWLSAGAADALKKHTQSVFADVNVLVLDGGMDALVVGRDGGESKG